MKKGPRTDPSFHMPLAGLVERENVVSPHHWTPSPASRA